MGNINKKKLDNNKKTIDSAVARVRGAVRVANVTVGEVMEIKDEALDEVAALKTESDSCWCIRRRIHFEFLRTIRSYWI
jgi:hypothetical protein